MRRLTRCVLVILLALTSASAADLRMGRAAIDITPPPGMPMGGNFRVRLNTGTHDPLYAKAIVLEQGGVEAAIVACDVVNMPRIFIDGARRIIADTTHVPPDNVMISATHSHTGPEMLDIFLDLMEGPPAQTAKNYRAALAGKIAQAVKEAEANLQPTEVWAGIGHEDSLPFNRRFLMKDGTIGWNPGKMNPNIVRPAGPVDPDVSMVYFQGAPSKPLATFVNYAMHLDTTGGLAYSADYAYTLGKLLAAAKDPDMLTIFAIGAAGDINHINVKTPERQGSIQEAARIGTILASAVLKTYPRLTPVTGPLQVRREVIPVPLQEFQPSDVEKSREMVTRAIKQGDNFPFLDLVRAVKILLVAQYKGQPLHAQVEVVSLGRDVAWVGLPGEVFVELGMAVKLASPFRYTIVDELTNDNIHYVPDRKAFAEGNYEPTNSIIAPGGGEAMVDAATRLLIDAYKSAAP
jgi:neutral ceramidase